jgi:hypothetical protein
MQVGGHIVLQAPELGLLNRVMLDAGYQRIPT